MDPLTLVGLAAAAYYFTAGKEKEEDEEDFEETSPGEIEPPKPGEARIRIKGINRFFDSVRWEVIMPDGEDHDFKIKLKKDQDMTKRLGNVWMTASIIEGSDYSKKGVVEPYAVQITLLNSAKKPFRSKRVIVPTKQVIDIM